MGSAASQSSVSPSRFRTRCTMTGSTGGPHAARTALCLHDERDGFFAAVCIANCLERRLPVERWNLLGYPALDVADNRGGPALVRLIACLRPVNCAHLNSPRTVR